MCRFEWWEKLRDRVGEIQGEGERDGEREGMEEGGKTNSPRQERIQRGERGSRAARAGRGERVVREKEPDLSERRGKTTGLLKKFYLVGTLGLSDATERRCGVVGHGVVARPFRQRVANKESKRRKERRSRSCAAISGLDRSTRHQLPSVLSARASANVRAKGTTKNHRGNSWQTFIRRKQQPSLEESFFHRSFRHALSLRCRSREKERANEKD